MKVVFHREAEKYLDRLPEHFIQAMMPLVTCMAEEYWKPVIEPASPEECAMMEDRLKEYETHPENWVSWEEIKRKRKLAQSAEPK